MTGTTSFPAALDSHTGGSPFGFAETPNFKSTTLSGLHSNAVTTITVVSTTGFPTRGYISIDTEVISYTGTTATTFTGATRAANSTTAASHVDTSTVAICPTAAHHDDLAAGIVASETKIGISESAAVDTPVANTVLQSLTSGKSKWATIPTAMIAANAVTSAKIDWSTVPCALAFNSAVQSITNNTETTVLFDSESFDTDTMHSTSSNTGRVTFTTAGKYAIIGCAAFASNATGYREGDLRINGTTYICTCKLGANAASSHEHMVIAFYNAAAADYVELRVLQTSGGNLNTVGAVGGNFLAAVRIG